MSRPWNAVLAPAATPSSSAPPSGPPLRRKARRVAFGPVAADAPLGGTGVPPALRPGLEGKDLAKLVQEWDDMELIRRMRRDELAFQLKSEMD